MTMQTSIQIAGLFHLGLIAAGITMPRVVKLREHLRGLPTFIRRLFWVYYGFIGSSLVSFGLLSFFMAADLASGAPLARAVCGFLCLFWTLRLVVAVRVFDVSPYLQSTRLRMGYHATNLVFTVLPVVYAVAALKGEY
jgi:hypothetical protein